MSCSRTIYTKNLAHLGDCIYSIIMFSHIKDYIETNKIIFYFYCLDENLKEVIDFNNSNNIIILPSSRATTSHHIYDLWIGSSEYKYNWYSFIDQTETILNYDVFFKTYYNKLFSILNIPIKIEKFTYNDDDLVTRCNNINATTNNAFMNIDFFINNGAPRSGQLDYNLDEWNAFIIELSKKYNVITTQKVHGIKCTRDYNLTVKDIAAVSLNIPKFIAIESGVITGLYNKFVVDNPQKVVFTISKYSYHACSFNNFIWVSGINKLKCLLY